MMQQQTPADDPKDIALWHGLYHLYRPLPGTTAPTKWAPYDIAIRDSAGVPRRITKIVPYPSGGFAVMVPQHSARQGWAFKHQCDYTKATWTTAWSDTVRYTANDEVKLSLHPDGFVQFSGVTSSSIFSGRDPATGVIKGLGVMSNPFSTPIYSGPTFGVLAWGFQDFPEARPKTRSSLVLFEPEDVYFRGEGLESFAVEGFLFTPWFLPHVRARAGARYSRMYTLPLWRFHVRGSRLWRFTVLPGVGAPHVLVAIRISRHPSGWSAPSGYHLYGPAERAPGPVRWLLSAFYPAPEGGVPPTESLDRET
jgi:hypothetical protein